TASRAARSSSCPAQCLEFCSPGAGQTIPSSSSEHSSEQPSACTRSIVTLLEFLSGISEHWEWGPPSQERLFSVTLRLTVSLRLCPLFTRALRPHTTPL